MEPDLNPLDTALEVWVSHPHIPAALRYTRTAPDRAWAVTAVMAPITGSPSTWAKYLPWDTLRTPFRAHGALLWTRPPTIPEVEAAYAGGQLADWRTAAARGLPTLLAPDPPTPPLDPQASRSEQVAAVYIAASTSGRHPTVAVAEHFAVPGSTATNWVRSARIAGHLPPTTPGRAT